MFLCIDCDNFFLQPMTKWNHLESLSLIALGISAGCSDLFLLSSDRFLHHSASSPPPLPPCISCPHSRLVRRQDRRVLRPKLSVSIPLSSSQHRRVCEPVCLSRKHIFDAAEASVKRLGICIDGLQMHRLGQGAPPLEIMRALWVEFQRAYRTSCV